MVTIHQVGAYLIGLGSAMLKTNSVVGIDPDDAQREIIISTMMKNGVDSKVAERVIEECLDGLDFNQRGLGVGLPYESPDDDIDDWADDDVLDEDPIHQLSTDEQGRTRADVDTDDAEFD